MRSWQLCVAYLLLRHIAPRSLWRMHPNALMFAATVTTSCCGARTCELKVDKVLLVL
jgi:hypothetical protein